MIGRDLLREKRFPLLVAAGHAPTHGFDRRDRVFKRGACFLFPSHGPKRAAAQGECGGEVHRLPELAIKLGRLLRLGERGLVVAACAGDPGQSENSLRFAGDVVQLEREFSALLVIFAGRVEVPALQFQPAEKGERILHPRPELVLFRHSLGAPYVLDRVIKIAQCLIGGPDVVKDKRHVPGVVVGHDCPGAFVKFERPLRFALRSVDFPDAVERRHDAFAIVDFFRKSEGAVERSEGVSKIGLAQEDDPAGLFRADELMLEMRMRFVESDRLIDRVERVAPVARFAQDEGKLQLRPGRLFARAGFARKAQDEIAIRGGAGIIARQGEVVSASEELVAQCLAGNIFRGGLQQIRLFGECFRRLEPLENFRRELAIRCAQGHRRTNEER